MTAADGGASGGVPHAHLVDDEEQRARSSAPSDRSRRRLRGGRRGAGAGAGACADRRGDGGARPVRALPRRCRFRHACAASPRSSGGFVGGVLARLGPLRRRLVERAGQPVLLRLRLVPRLIARSDLRERPPRSDSAAPAAAPAAWRRSPAARGAAQPSSDGGGRRETISRSSRRVSGAANGGVPLDHLVAA